MVFYYQKKEVIAMLEINKEEVQHVYYFLSYCGAHRDCFSCAIVEYCKKLEVHILHQIKYEERLPLSKEDILVVLNLREYCHDCNRCTIRCNRKIECDKLMYAIIDDHKASKKPKTLTGDAANGNR